MDANNFEILHAILYLLYQFALIYHRLNSFNMINGIKTFILLTFVFGFHLAYGQQDTSTASEDSVKNEQNVHSDLELLVDDQPEYPGGIDSLMRFVQNNYVYPKEDRKAGNSGVIYVRFVVHKDGKAGNFEIMRGINDRMDTEAIRVLSMMDKWSPAKLNGKPVKVSYMIPIRLQLQ